MFLHKLGGIFVPGGNDRIYKQIARNSIVV